MDVEEKVLVPLLQQESSTQSIQLDSLVNHNSTLANSSPEAGTNTSPNGTTRVSTRIALRGHSKPWLVNKSWSSERHSTSTTARVLHQPSRTILNENEPVPDGEKPILEPIVIQVRNKRKLNQKKFRIKSKKKRTINPVMKQQISSKKDKCQKQGLSQKEGARKKKKVKKVKKSAPTSASTISEYEKMILKNIEERKKMFELLKLGDAKHEFNQTFNLTSNINPSTPESLASKAHPLLEQKLERKKSATPTISEYEKMILKNVEERNKKFELLKLGAEHEVDQTFNLASNIGSSSPESSVSKAHSLLKRNLDSPEPVRRSSRCPRPNHNSESIMMHLHKRTRRDRTLKGKKSGKIGKLSFEAQGEVAELKRNSLPIEGLHSSVVSSAIINEDLSEFRRSMSSFNLVQDACKVMIPDKLHALSWHPSSSKLLLAAGDQVGNIGFWDVDNKNEIQCGSKFYGIHNSPICAMSFDISNHSKIFSTSYDFVHSLDLRSETFEEMFSPETTGDIVTTYHIQKDQSSLLASLSNGEVVLIDVRTPGRAEIRSQCLGGTIQNLSKHPLNENAFLAASCRNGMGVFDLRYLNGRSLTSFPTSLTSIQRAFFSPKTGSRVLLNLGHRDNNCASIVFDLHAGREVRCVSTVEHKSTLAAARSTWHPQREDIFIAGGTQHPRSIDMFYAPSGQLFHQFKSDWLASVCCFNTFHPSVPILASGNTTGRVHVFRPL